MADCWQPGPAPLTLRDPEEEAHYCSSNIVIVNQCLERKFNTKWTARTLKNGEKCVFANFMKQELFCMG